jgi:predicted RNA polymerase sigma factor
MRLCGIICRSKEINNCNAQALMALMCFNASRSEARMDAVGNILLLKQQDRKKWDRPLIEKGVEHLEASTNGIAFSNYHLEAGIAYEHARAPDYVRTNWKAILQYYDLLQQHYPSPVIALNRAIVVGELNGAAAGISAIEAIANREALEKYYLLPATLGELHWQLRQYDAARNYFAAAMLLTQSAPEKKLLEQKINQPET